MFNFFKKKEKFPSALFVAASLSALVLFVILLVLSRVNYNPIFGIYNQPFEASKINQAWTAEQKSDELITRVPNLKDVITKPIISNNDPSLGNDDAKINLVIFSDFICDYCKKQEETLELARKKYNLRLIWKDFPETNENSLSFKAAIAGRCAQKENKFWEFHDRIFESASPLSQELLINSAVGLGMDRKKFLQCLNDDSVSKLVWDNIEEANALGITGIPFMFLNDKEIMGEADYEELVEMIKNEAD